MRAGGAKRDVLWAYQTLLLMKERGRARSCGGPSGRNIHWRSVCYDGRYVWATAHVFDERLVLIVIDPLTFMRGR